MPFGIDLDDITDALNPFDDDGKRRPLPKRKKRKKDRFLDRVTGDALVPRVPKIVRSAAGDIAEIGAGVIPAARAVGGAAYRDVRAAQRAIARRDMPDRDDVRDFVRLAKWTVADAKGDKKKRPKTDSELLGLGFEMIRAWGRGIERAIPDLTNSQDVKEARRTWREDPVFAILDVLPVGAAVGRAGSVASMAPRLGVKGAVKESYRPGAARRAGREGGIEPRVHRVQIGDEVREVPGRPWSRNPFMREIQRHYDDTFARSPDAQMRRVARVEERMAREQQRRIKLETDELSMPMANLVYGELGRMMGTFALRKDMTPAQRRKATAAAYAFQMPRHMDPQESLAAVQADLANVLESGHIEYGGKTAPLKQSDKEALTIQIADLDEVRRDLASGSLSTEEFRTAMGTMGEIAKRTQDMGLDIMRDFRQLDPEQMDEIRQAWTNRADMLPRRLRRKGFLAPSLAESEVRAARIEEWRGALGDEQAGALTEFYDSIARGVRPNDPASFYADRVGMPGQTVGNLALEQRVTTQHGMQPLIEGAAEAPAGATAFYSPLQRWVEEEMPAKMQAGQLDAALRRKIPREEFYNLGLDNFLNQYGRNDVLLKAEFQNFLANPLNAYNLREVHFVNTHEADAVGLAARYDIEHQGNYVSRDPAMGEYHEVVMELPDPTKARDKTYRGTGRAHWDRDNVAVHARFHVFEEDGKIKLLIEEIQSDWANDFRKEEARGRKYRDLTDEEAAEFDRLREAIEENGMLLAQARTRMNEADERIRAGEGGHDVAWYEARDDVDRYREEQRILDEEYDVLNDEFALGNVPPPPLGRGVSERSSYLNAMTRWLHRYAAENDVDEIIVISREAQLVRNAKAIDPRQWAGFRGGNAEDVTRHFADQGPHPTRAYISYEKDIPDVLARELGVEGRRVEDAYEGQYRVPHDFEEQAAGRMPGTVFTMTDEARAAALRPRSMYQRQPDWPNLPKGAVELAEGGGYRQIHAFKDADVSTWIHELGHVALYDLPLSDRAILEGHYAGGRSLDEWKRMEHESFARDFEEYVRKGTAPVDALAEVFRKLAAWVQQIWRMEKQKGRTLDPEIEAVFDRMFSAPDSDLGETWGYFPHRDFTQMAQQTYRGGVRPPAAGQTIGRPRLAGDTIQRNPNEQILYQTGRLSADPSQLVDVFLKRLRFQETLAARDELWAMGRPLSEQPPPGAWLVRDPRATAERIRPEAQAAVRGQDTTLPIEQRVLEELDDDLATDFNTVRQEMIARPEEHPRWESDAESVRWVPGEYVETRFGEVFEQRPRGSMWSALGLLNSLQRTTGIYGRPFSYVGGNVPFNLMSLFATMPLSTLRNAPMTFRLMRGNPAERKLYRAIASETGETRASGGLPDFYVRAQNRMQEAEQRTSQFQRAAADKLSAVADSPFRVTAFLNNARKRGHKTDDDIRALIEEGGPELSDIRQMTREQLLDFDSLNPTQRRMASQFLYLWPFIYASVKWPAMFAREYPARAAVGANLTQEEGEGEPVSIANLWKKYGVDLGTLNPVGPVAEIAEQLQLLMQDPGSVDMTVLQDRLSPTLAFLVQGMGGGKKNAFQNFLRQTIPGASEAFSADPRFRGGKQYEDRSAGSYLLQRHTRFWPRGVNMEVIRERVEQHEKDRITADTHELERNEDWKKITQRYKLVGGDAEAIRRSYKAWWDYQEAVAEKKDATGQRKLTTLQTIEVLDEIARDSFPELEGQLWDVERMRDEEYQRENAEAMDDYAEALKNYINDARDQLSTDYSYATQD